MLVLLKDFLLVSMGMGIGVLTAYFSLRDSLKHGCPFHLETYERS